MARRTTARSNPSRAAAWPPALFLALQPLLYLSGLPLVRLSTGALTLFSGWPSQVRHHDDAPLVGSLVTVFWSLLIGVFAAAAAQSLAAFWIGAGCSLPVTLLVGLQVYQWRRNRFYAQLPGSLVLGSRRLPPFDLLQVYAVNPTDRFKQIFIEGPMGSGKSTTLIKSVLSDIRSGAGVCVIDPKDDLVDKILPHIPPHREQDVILFDIADTQWPVGLNQFDGVPPERRSLAASEVVAVLRRYFASSWGPRLEHLLLNCILALLEVPGATLLDIPRLLLDPAFAEEVFSQAQNPGVRQFYVEFQQMLQKRGDALAPVLNKTGAWMSFPELRNIIGQQQTSFNIRRVMDEGKILLVRIPQGVAGEEISSLLAALIVAMVQLAAHSRVDTPQERRRPFYLYADEFQLYANSSFLKLLTESRAFRLGLVCATQYLRRLPEELQHAITANVATSIECLGQPGPYQLRVRRLAALRRNPDAEPLLLTPLPPPPAGDPAAAERIRALSRSQYARPRQEVEAAILQRVGGISAGTRNQAGKRGARRVVGGVDIDEE